MPNPRVIYDGDPIKPIHIVWELTMRCDHACAHCGSRAGKPRQNELELPELLAVADSVVAIGCREVALIGGEAYLHPAVFTVTERLVQGGVRVIMQTGGRGLDSSVARSLKAAGMHGIGVSVDGPPAIHDRLRASIGSHRAAVAALYAAGEAGLATGVNTQVNRLNHLLLRETLADLRPTGIRAWRAQLTAPMGRAADQPDWLLEPWQILGVIDTLAAIQLELAEQAYAVGGGPKQVLDVQLGNNLGYYGPHEVVLRSSPGGELRTYQGCQAGQYGLGIESDGNVKGCPSLPSQPYVGGNLRERTLEQIWNEAPEIGFARAARLDELWGFCRTCAYADICQAGCSFTTHTTLGRRGNNPFCYHRAATLRRRGRRERLIQVKGAAGKPYDFGRFQLVEEDWVDQD